MKRTPKDFDIITTADLTQVLFYSLYFNLYMVSGIKLTNCLDSIHWMKHIYTLFFAK